MNIDRLLWEAGKNDPLAFGITHISLGQGKKWQVDERKWIIDIYKALHPGGIAADPQAARQLVLMKPTQVGMSTMGLVKNIHFATYWPVRTIYTLPRQQDILDFVGTRVDPIMKGSPFLKSLLQQPDSTRVKGYGQSYLFFMELSVEPRMMPADALYIDEVDLSNPDHMGTAINRLDASNWKLIHYFGTPTITNYGVDGLYKTSDQRVWMVTCPACNEEQHLDWEANIRIVGNVQDPQEVYYACTKCDRRLGHEEIQNGRWVATKPERTAYMLGYHISQMMTHSAEELYRIYVNPNTDIKEFYRKRLGKPYDVGAGFVTRADILANCFRTPVKFETKNQAGATYYMGVDQGNELQVVVAKLPDGKNQPQIVHIELIPIEEGFDKVGKLMHQFNVKKCVIDGEPNKHSVRQLIKNFPGRIIMADYAVIDARFRTSAKISEVGDNTTTNVVINRTDGLDDLVATLKAGWWLLPGAAENPHPMVELLIGHITSLRRDLEKKRTPSGEVVTAIWRKLGPDHLAHSMVYLKTALDMSKRQAFRVAVPGLPDIFVPEEVKGVGTVEMDADEPLPVEEQPKTEAPKRAVRIR